MKKLLALVLALVMTLSLATVSTNAAFADADDISYEEAANVLSAVGVFVGDGKNFNPKAALNREQAAKLVAYMILGEDVAEALPTVVMFDDVPASSWAAKYIAYCADAGIITGDGAGKFFPASPVDGYAFSKMLLCALGYKAEAEGYTGGNWQINVATDAKAAGFNTGFNGKMEQGLTREEAAQIMFNAIKANKVTYSQTGNSVTIGDVVVNQAWGDASPGAVYYQAQWDGVAGNDYLQLADASAYDAFGREAREWQFNGEVVSKVADDTADFVITKNLTQSEIAAMLKGYKLGEYKVNDDTAVSATVSLTKGESPYSYNFAGDTIVDGLDHLFADGVCVEIFANTSKEINQIVVMNYDFHEVTDVTTNSKTGAVTYTFDVIGDYTNDADTTKVVFAAEVAEDDYVTTFAGLDGKLYVYPTTKMTGDCTKVNTSGVYTINGDAFKVSEADAASYTLDISANNNYWLDQYGFIVYSDTVATAHSNYAMVLGYDIDSDTSFGAYSPALKIKALLADGTVGIYDVKTKKIDGAYYVVDADGTKLSNSDLEANEGTVMADLVGNVYAYSLKDGVIALQDISTPAAGETFVKQMNANYHNNADTNYIGKNDAAIAAGYAVGKDAVLNNATTFIFYDEDDGATVVVGNDKLGKIKFGYSADNDVVMAANDAGTAFTAKFVFVMANWNTNAASTEKYGFVDFSEYETTKNADEEAVYTFTMYLTDGTKLSVTTDTLTGYTGVKGLYEVDADGEVLDAYDGSTVVAGVCASYANGVAKIGSTNYTVSSSLKVVDLSDEYSTLEDAYVIAVLDEDTSKVIEVAYIFDDSSMDV